jgi:hypothetical protein
MEIGPEIKKVLDASGMSYAEFGRRINCSRDNVYDLLKRKSIDTEMLKKVSEVLNNDFFLLYTDTGKRVKDLEEEVAMYRALVKRLLANDL